MSVNSGLFTSNNDAWGTPQALFNALDSEFHFELDVCALPENAKCRNYYSPSDNGLVQPWPGRCWMNPPYGRSIGEWVKKAYEAPKERGGGCCLPTPSENRYGMVA